MNFFSKKTNIDFLGMRKPALALSGALILLTFLLPFIREPNWGVDFAGGTEMQVKFSGAVDAGALRETLASAGLDDVTIQVFGAEDENEFLVRTRRASLFSDEEFASQVAPKLRQALPGLAEGESGIEFSEKEGDQVTLLAAEGKSLSSDEVRGAFENNGWRVQDVRSLVEGRSYAVILRGVGDKVETLLAEKFSAQTPDVLRVEQVGASVGSELKASAIKSILLSILLILLYVGFRFDFRFAPGGIIALAHDAILVAGFYLVTGAEINTTTIAALLTIVGFSINDTIVIFDRVRENMQKQKGAELEKTMNIALNETLSRTILTSLVVLLSLIGLVIFTVGSLQDFALAMSFGVLVGCYSTVFLATPIVIWMDEILKAREITKGQGPTTPAAV